MVQLALMAAAAVERKADRESKRRLDGPHAVCCRSGCSPWQRLVLCESAGKRCVTPDIGEEAEHHRLQSHAWADSELHHGRGRVVAHGDGSEPPIVLVARKLVVSQSKIQIHSGKDGKG